MKSLYLYFIYCKKNIDRCWSPFLCIEFSSGQYVLKQSQNSLKTSYAFSLHVTDFLKLTLENYVKNLDVPVKIIRMEERSGLIRARLRGAAASKGQVITFLDAHCECTLGWLEPLLARIKEDR